MIDSQQKYEALREAREKDRRKKARETLKRYSAGRNIGKAKSTISSVKNLMENITPLGFFSLAKQMNIFYDWMYGLALMAAILKDVLDFMALTGVLYGLVIVITFLCSIFIAMMMLLGSFSNGAGRTQQKIIRSWLVLLGGTTVEMIFGLNFLPIETLTVLVVYMMALSARKQSKQYDRGQMQESYA